MDGSTVSNPMAIWNVFNYYFSSIASNTKLKIFPFRINIFSDYLINKSNVSFFLSPTDKVVIMNAISSLDPNVSVGPNIILIKILKLLKNDITSRLTNIFNLPFFSCFFPLILKIAMVIQVHKKDSRLDFSIYPLISLLSNIGHFLERLMRKINQQ